MKAYQFVIKGSITKETYRDLWKARPEMLRAKKIIVDLGECHGGSVEYGFKIYKRLRALGKNGRCIETIAPIPESIAVALAGDTVKIKQK